MAPEIPSGLSTYGSECWTTSLSPRSVDTALSAHPVSWGGASPTQCHGVEASPTQRHGGVEAPPTQRHGGVEAPPTQRENLFLYHSTHS